MSISVFGFLQCMPVSDCLTVSHGHLRHPRGWVPLERPGPKGEGCAAHFAHGVVLGGWGS